MIHINIYLNFKLKRFRFIYFSSYPYVYTVRYVPKILSFYNIETLKSLKIPIDNTSKIGKKTKFIN